MAENQGGTAAVVDNSPSLVAWVGEQYGDFAADAPETETGAPPVETSDPPADSEGTAASAPTDAPSVEAEPESEPDPSPPDPVADVDPFEGSHPLPYTVDGQERSFDGITVLKDGGAIIDPEALEKVQRVFGERDHLFEKARAEYEKSSTLERATAWRTTGPDGKEQTLTGLQAVEAARVYTAQMVAKTITYERAFDAMVADPTNFAKLYAIVTDERGEYGPAGQQYVVPNKAGFEELKREAAIFARESALSARSHFSAQAAPPPPPETPVSDLALPTIESIIAAQKITGLTPEDKTFLAQQFGRYVVTTKEGRAVDPSFVDLLKDRADLRSKTTATVAAVTTAAPRNAARLAAASVGKRPAAKPAPVRRPESEDDQETDFDRAFFNRQKAAAGALRAHHIGA